MWFCLGLNQGPPDYESGATNQLSYRTNYISTRICHKNYAILCEMCNYLKFASILSACWRVIICCDSVSSGIFTSKPTLTLSGLAILSLFAI